MLCYLLFGMGFLIPIWELLVVCLVGFVCSWYLHSSWVWSWYCRLRACHSTSACVWIIHGAHQMETDLFYVLCCWIFYNCFVFECEDGIFHWWHMCHKLCAEKIALYPKFCFKEIVIHEDEMGWAYGMHGNFHKCIQNFIWKAWREMII
jgi:hypothetical protein